MVLGEVDWKSLQGWVSQDLIPVPSDCCLIVMHGGLKYSHCCCCVAPVSLKGTQSVREVVLIRADLTPVGRPFSLEAV